jgi:Nucleotidyl transferase AbiEii toxin, Type IV TA system/Dynamin family
VDEWESAKDRLSKCERLLRDFCDGNVQLAEAIRSACGRLDQPMRVAISGQLKRGKSVLVNALLGADVAPTAQLEATFTVGEFYAAEQPQVVVHFRSRRDPLVVGPDDFRRYTVNDPAQMALLREIRRVEFGLPNPLLQRFRLLDTPGLGSIYGADSDNAIEALGIQGFLDPAETEHLAAMLRTLGRTATDVQRDTLEAVDGADAVVYVFDRGLNEGDVAAVADFLGPRGPGLNAIKAVGVLSRCDVSYWPPPFDRPQDHDPLSYDPVKMASGIVGRYLARPEIRRVFFDILPVAALAAAGGATLTTEELNWLEDLTRTEPATLASALEDVNHFTSAEHLIATTLSRECREQLVRRLGAWGLLRTAGYLDVDVRAYNGTSSRWHHVRAALAAFAAVTTERGWDLDIVRGSETFARAVVRRGADVVLLDLAVDATPQRPPTVPFVGPTLDPDELAARKVVALFDRAEARDFADVYALARRYGTERLVEMAKAVNPGLRRRRPGDYVRFARQIHRRRNPCP